MSVPEDKKKIVELLNEIIEMEISAVIRYLHYALMIKGPNRIPIVKWFHDQANEGYAHASMIGEKITAYGGHPSLKVSPVPETNTHKVLDILAESLDFELKALAKYKDLLKHVGDDVALEELVRGQIRLETEHVEEVRKMLDVNH
ncbi:ferritin-like domain-containing protein [Bdellovibrio sp. GT3]|uniref:ferritin-like domain-containing protein n=1 Tax=unclassified Bdellovibrio TaxID=2633795 RepID=UPI0030F198C4